MASPLELLGIENGLGPVTTGLQQFERNEQAQATALADMYLKQQQANNANIAGQQAQLELDQARQLSPSKVQVGMAENTAKTGEATLAKQQQFGQMITQAGSYLDQIPVNQRGAILQRMAQQIPGIDQDPSFQVLANTDPSQLPLALKQLGTQMLMQTGDQMRKQALQKQSEDARMAQARMEQGAATGRAAMGDNAAMKRLQMQLDANRQLEADRIAAGKYRDKRAANDPATVASKMGYEKAAVYYDALARQTKDPSEKADYEEASALMRQLNIDSKIAGVKPGTTLDSSGNIVPNLPLGAPGGGGSINPPSAGAGDLQRAATQAFGGYDPQKYEYRINPETGRVQRKAK